MSMHLHWRPVNPRTDRNLGQCTALRTILRRRFGTFPLKLGIVTAEYLGALADADVDGAAEIRAAIFEHGEVELEERA